MFFFRKAKCKAGNPLRTVLYTWTRTGASSLTAILSMHPDIRAIGEPFNPSQSHGQFVKNKNDKEFRLILDNLWREYNFIKHNHGLTKKQEEFLLTRSCNKVIFLWRRNSAKRVISNQLAKQTRIWNINNNPENKLKLMDFNYNPIEIKNILDEINNYLVSIETIRNFLRKNHVDYIELVYEDIYENNLDSGMMIISNLFNFLGLDANLSEEIIEKIHWRLEPDNFKQSTPDIYNKIPNIIEINTLLSNKGYGSLF